jgi:hypothetical protein
MFAAVLASFSYKNMSMVQFYRGENTTDKVQALYETARRKHANVKLTMSLSS